MVVCMCAGQGVEVYSQKDEAVYDYVDDSVKYDANGQTTFIDGKSAVNTNRGQGTHPDSWLYHSVGPDAFQALADSEDVAHIYEDSALIQHPETSQPRLTGHATTHAAADPVYEDPTPPHLGVSSYNI